MRGKLVFCLLIGLLAMLVAVVLNSSDRRDRHGNVGGYDVRAERILEGTVAGKGHLTDGLMYVSLKTADTTVEVQLGPKESVEPSSFMFKPGDMVIVVGVPVVLNEHDVVLARQS